MKITDVKTELYRWNRAQPISNGKHTYTDCTFGVVKIETNEGVTGLGIGNYDNSMVELFKPLLIGEDPVNVERLWSKMWVPKLVGRRGLTTRVISMIDIALWDLRGKITGLPVHKLLGGFRDKVPVYIAGGYYMENKDLKALADEMLEYVSWGVKAVKMKVGGRSMREDALRVKTVREAVGEDVKILLDANCAYKYYEAIEFANMVEEYTPFWFEEPVMPDDYEGFQKIAAKTNIPIATGENEYTRYGFRDLIERKAIPILNADACIMGGVTEFMKVAALAQAYNLDIAPHGNQEIHVPLVAAIENGLIVEYYTGKLDPMIGKIYTENIQLNKDGTVSPLPGVGFGFDLNNEALVPYRIG